MEIKLDDDEMNNLALLGNMGVSAPLAIALMMEKCLKNPDQKPSVKKKRNTTTMEYFIPFENEEQKEKVLKAFGLEDEEVKVETRNNR